MMDDVVLIQHPSGEELVGIVTCAGGRSAYVMVTEGAPAILVDYESSEGPYIKEVLAPARSTVFKLHPDDVVLLEGIHEPPAIGFIRNELAAWHPRIAALARSIQDEAPRTDVLLVWYTDLEGNFPGERLSWIVPGTNRIAGTNYVVTDILSRGSPWNVACDNTINQLLVDLGGIAAHRSAEQLYDELVQRGDAAGVRGLPEALTERPRPIPHDPLDKLRHELGHLQEAINAVQRALEAQ